MTQNRSRKGDDNMVDTEVIGIAPIYINLNSVQPVVEALFVHYQHSCT